MLGNFSLFTKVLSSEQDSKQALMKTQPHQREQGHLPHAGVSVTSLLKLENQPEHNTACEHTSPVRPPPPLAARCRWPRLCAQVRKNPWRREWQPIRAFLSGELHRQRSLEGYSPWGRKADPSSKATLWVKAQHEGALPPPCIVRKDPRVPHTARRGA